VSVSATATATALVLVLAAHAAAGELTVLEISASYPGHPATEVEASVTSPIETALGRLSGVDDLWSESRAGTATVWLSLPRAEGLRAAQTALQAAAPTLPADLPAPPTLMETPSDAPGVRFVVTNGTFDAGTFDRLLTDEIGARVAVVPGVARVSLCGTAPAETVVHVDAARLTAFGLAVVDVIAALRPGETDALSKTVLATRHGAPVRLDDVARIEVAPRSDCIAWRGAGRVGFGDVRLRRQAPAGAREAILAALRSSAPMLPPGISIAVLEPARPAELLISVPAGTSRDRTANLGIELARKLGDGGVVRWSAARPDRLEATVDDATEAARAGAALPGAAVRVRSQELALEVVAASRDVLAAAAETLAAAAAAGPDVAAFTVEGTGGAPTLELAVDPAQRDKLGVRGGDLQTTFTAAREGVLAAGVRVRVEAEPAAVLGLTVPSSSSRQVPLGAVAQLRQTVVPEVLRHAGRFPALTLWLRPRRPFSFLDALRLAIRLEWAAPADVRIRFRA
jgi:multidrug efflux pump subunit AcrB